MRTLSHSWLWTEPRVTPRSCTSPACSGVSHLGSRGAPTHTATCIRLDARPFTRATQQWLSPATGRSSQSGTKTWNAFLFFPSSARGLEDEARQLWSQAGFSSPHNYGIQWIEEKNYIWSTHCIRTKIFLRHHSFCSLKLSAFPSRYIRIKLCGRHDCQV